VQAIEIAQPGGPEVLRLVERPRPAPARGELLIRVLAAGVNRPDVLQRRGAYAPPPGASDLPGLEVAGVVEDGAFAEGAALPETYFTVWSNVFDRGQFAPGESLLVQGGTSGIGVAAIQLAAALGHRVFATAGSADKCRACEALGAQRGIDYRTEDFVAVVKQATGGRGVDVVLDMVAGDYVAREIDCLADDGRLLIIATLGGSKAQVDVGQVLRRRCRQLEDERQPGRQRGLAGVLRRQPCAVRCGGVPALRVPAAGARRPARGRGGRAGSQRRGAGCVYRRGGGRDAARSGRALGHRRALGAADAVRREQPGGGRQGCARAGAGTAADRVRRRDAG